MAAGWRSPGVRIDLEVAASASVAVASAWAATAAFAADRPGPVS